MKKRNTKLALVMAMLMVCSMVLAVVPATVQTAKAVAPPLWQFATGGASTPADGHVVSAMTIGGSTYMLTADGKVYSFGQGTRGELGDGIGQDGTLSGVSSYPLLNNDVQARPVRKWDDGSILTGVDRIYGGLYFTVYGYDADTGTLYGWGQNGNYRIDTNGQPYGSGGDICEEYNKAKVVTQIPAGVKLQGGAEGMAVGRFHVMFIDDAGAVWTYGQTNAYFRLGYNIAQGDPDTYYDASYNNVYTTKARQVPLPLNQGEKVVAVQTSTTEYISYALTDQGRIFVWGGPSLFGLIGASYQVLNKPVGTDVSFEYEKIAVSQGGNIIALGNDSKVYSLTVGNLMAGTFTPVLETALDQSAGISYVDIGGVGQVTTSAGFAVRDDLSVWAWGSQAYGQLADGQSTGTLTTATQNISLAGASVQTFYNGGIALKGDKLYCWGNNIDPNSGSKVMPIIDSPRATVLTQATNSMMPAALQLTGDEYPVDTPFADATYTLTAQAVDLNATLTVSGLATSFEGKQVEFYNEIGTSYGTATVTGGTASINITGLAEGDYQAFVKSNDTHDLLWGSALNGTSFTLTAPPPPLAKAMAGNGGSHAVDGHITSVLQSSGSTYILAADGKVFSFGQGTRGELGDGYGQGGALGGVSSYPMENNITQARPVRKWADGEILTGIDYIYAGLYFTVFGYDADTHTLYGWGQNGNYRIDSIGQPYGGGGDVCEEYNKAKVVTQIPAGLKLKGGAQGVAVGRYHVSFIDIDGNVWTYGQATDNFRLGYPLAQGDPDTYYDAGMTTLYTTKARQVPLPLNINEKAKAVSIGHYTEQTNFVLTDKGRIIVWGGTNLFGLIGSTHKVLSNPAGTSGSFKYVKTAVAQGGTLMALGNDGKIYSLLNDSLTTGTYQPTLVTALDQSAGISYVDVGAVGQTPTTSGFAVRDDGSVWGWGSQAYGQLGNGLYTGTATTAVEMTALTGASIQGFYNSMVATMGDKLYCWGNNVDANSGSKIMPIAESPRATVPTVALNSMMPAQLQLTDGEYAIGTPFADATYTLSAVVTDSDAVLTVTGVDARLEGKTVEFYNETGTSYGTDTVTGGTASVTVTGLADGSYQAIVKSLDATELLWAPAANGITFVIGAVAPIVTGVEEGGVYNTPHTITFDVGTATLNGNPFDSGSTVSAVGTYTLVATNATEVTTVNFEIKAVTLTPFRFITTAPGPQIYVAGIVTSAVGVPLTTGGEFKACIITQSDITAKVVKKTNGSELLDTAKVATGMTVDLVDGASAVFKTYNIVIYGDINGDAIINAMDLLALKKKVLSQITLDGAYLIAANCNKGVDNVVNAMDMLALKKHILGQVYIVQ